MNVPIFLLLFVMVTLVTNGNNICSDHAEINADQCPALRQSSADIDTVALYPTFEFQPSWMRTKSFWTKPFEERYEQIRNDPQRPKLKVIVVPHSHNDPGWLKTFEQYFELKSKNIINNIVHKLQQYPNMTFIWNEMSFLSAWWEISHPLKRKALMKLIKDKPIVVQPLKKLIKDKPIVVQSLKKLIKDKPIVVQALKKLIKEGRLEITTGGWVMADEACTHVFALIDQLIEGHQWVKNYLEVTPKTGWSIDPFGHGPTVPYLLDKSGLVGTIIGRIHYAWKQWLAERQVEVFYWLPGWSAKRPSLVVHNLPFDIYSIESTCGPHPSVCATYDFWINPREYAVTQENIYSKSKILIEEYKRIGTLTPHNVVLVPLGEDFSYSTSTELDVMFNNYMKMFNYINSHREMFNAEVKFGTILDYFNALKDRYTNIPTLKGDFFVYSDLFNEGIPAYWSGYYTTRPYIKILARQFEHQLRSSEILFTLVSNFIKQSNKRYIMASENRLEKLYNQLVNARRNLGLLQHHDGITGTSKAYVMYDYGTKILTSLNHCLRLQEVALTALMVTDPALNSQTTLKSGTEWKTYGKQPKKLQITFVDKKKLILFNPLAEARTEIITVCTNTTNVRIYDTSKKEYVQYQISPNFDFSKEGKTVISKTNFDVFFVAKMAPLSSVTFNLEEHANKSHHSIVFCTRCNEENNQLFSTNGMRSGDLKLENSVLKLVINGYTGFLRKIYRKDLTKKNVVEIQFGAYKSMKTYSGAYLFKPGYKSPEKNVLNALSKWHKVRDKIIIVSGPVYAEIKTTYLPLLIHTVRIYKVDDHALSCGVYIENSVDFEKPPKNKETELFMRIRTDIQNGDIPEFYTDQNGFQYQKRVKVDKVGIEANYYPITTMAWLQDENTRMSLVTNHAQGAAAFEPGQLEVMLDRRMLNDDLRGLGEGINDNKPTIFQNWLVLESMTKPRRGKCETSVNVDKQSKEQDLNPDEKDATYQLPSQTSDYLSRTLNYPVNVFMLDTSNVSDIEVKTHHSMVTDFPSRIHLLTLRTITDDILKQSPSSSCFMVLQRPGYDCEVGNKLSSKPIKFTSKSALNGLIIKNLTAVSLTGLKTYQALSSLEDIELEPMEVKTYKIEFDFFLYTC